MAIPDFQTLMLPFLRCLNDDQPHSISDIYESLSDEFQLTQEERSEMLSSGRQGVMRNRIGWARTYLKKAGLIESPERGIAQISERGKAVLEGSPERVDRNYLMQFPEFIAFLNGYRREGDLEFQDSNRIDKRASSEESVELETPEEQINNAFESLRTTLASEILDVVMQSSPAFFERLVVDLLVKMG